MKKVIILTTVFVLIAAWCVRYYTLNGTFAMHNQYPTEVYKMHETVEFGTVFHIMYMNNPDMQYLWNLQE